MATRRAVLQQKTALKSDLRTGCRNGTFLPGDPAPSLRELALQYGLSRTVVAQAMGDLIEEGVLHSVPRIGTFIGRPALSRSGFYLFLTPYPVAHNYHYMMVQEGFEEAIARLGGASLSLTWELAHKLQGDGELPPLAGVFDMGSSCGEPDPGEFWPQAGSARVHFSSTEDVAPDTDSIAFDNVDGGRQAARHLMQLGQQRIAYLALHSPLSDPMLNFSAERELGWRQAQEAAGFSADDLAFHPSVATNACHESQVAGARSAAVALVRRRDIGAVIAANVNALRGLFEELTAAGVPSAQWPTVVSFDDESMKESHVVSALRLPWSELGGAAASLLWDRVNNRSQGPPEHRLVPMRMISRLTSRPEWARASNLAASQLTGGGIQTERQETVSI